MQKHLLEIEYNSIINFFVGNDVAYKGRIGLHAGISGIILLLATDYLKSHNENCLAQINEYLDIGLTSIKDGNITPNLSGGLAGFAWVVDFLIQNDIIDSESEKILETFDTFLEKQMDGLLNEGFYDQLNGAIGIGLYLLQRKKYRAIQSIIDFLFEKKIVFKNQYLWVVDKKNRLPKPVFDYGVAHGAAGLLYFIIRCIKDNISTAKCSKLINGIINFYATNEQDYKYIGSFYPSFVEYDIFFSNDTKKRCTHSRLAWCYGDLGILHTLFCTSVYLDNSSYKEKILNKLLTTAKRIDDKDTNIVDAGFCHGSAGAAFLFWDLYLKTNYQLFKNASDYWLQKTFEFNDKKEGKPNYNFTASSIAEERGMCYNLLDGLCGVGLVYNYILNSSLPPNTKDILMLL